MPTWLLNLITSLGLPALKQLLIAALTGLEAAYPGIASLCQAILSFIEAGGSAAAVQAHLEANLQGFKPVAPKA